MKQFLRDYFTFNRRERRGILFLLIIIALLLIYLSVSNYFFREEKHDFSSFEKEIKEFQKQQSAEDSLDETKYNYAQSDYKLPSASSNEIRKAEHFDFNPNHLSESDWKRLGLSDKQIHVIKNYESKGGKFRVKEDVKKMYCIPPALYASLEPYIILPVENFRKIEPVNKKSEKLLIELNSADTISLDKLNGVGFTFAKRITKYREMLGGYVNKEQLLEIYGFDKEKYDLISENVFVDTLQIKKININTATAVEMKKHPYIKFNLANLMVSYRKQHGDYKSVDEVKKLVLVNDELFVKLACYLTTK